VCGPKVDGMADSAPLSRELPLLIFRHGDVNSPVMRSCVARTI
jgi:hypothetical protein